MGRIDLDVEITPDGKVKLKVSGVPGNKCLEITQELEKELGEVLSREYTSEYYIEEEQEKETIKQESNS